MSDLGAAQQDGPFVIDVVSDVVCPWCYVGKRRLEAALLQHPDLRVELRWRPFQLDPTIPPGGVSRVEYLTKKFGADRIGEIHDRLSKVGEEAGIPFAFDSIKVSPNTLDAHRTIRWAASAGCQSELVEKLFSAYFIEGKDIGDPLVLAKLAGECGMQPDIVTRLLAGDEDKTDVQEEIATAVRLGVTGVPFFIFAGQFGVPGAQDALVLAAAIDKAVRAQQGHEVA